MPHQRRKQGANVHDALLEACPIRLRPIIMTSVSTIAAAVPTALALGAGAETRAPMAQVVIGGVVLSTFLTLFVVPCVYSLMSRFESQKHNEGLKKALVELGELKEGEGV
jgi:HAE1 family hydrophobic/amphiphilic exporter-1